MYLPQTLGKISGRIPPESGLTTERFIIGNTIFPYLKPFLPKERGLCVLDLLKSDITEKELAHRITGLPRSKSPKWQYLRYCEDCWKEDIQTYGEAYWHRLHLLPGVMICPLHGKPIQDSLIFLKDIQMKFYPASFRWASDTVPETRYSDDMITKLMAVSKDSAWLLQNGYALGFSETMIRIYDQLLRVKGYRSLSGRRTKNKELYGALCDFYGRDFLKILDAYSEGLIPWSQRMIHKQDALLYPVYYLLLMQFLAGSTEEFFLKQHDKAHPYGKGPWPCRNHICPYHLQDVIIDIVLIQECDRHKATFTCPHCGFAYRRSREKTKSKQYGGQINIVDYGWLWLDTFQKQMAAGVPIMKITEVLHCGYRTVMQLGVEFGFFPEDRLPVKKSHVPPEKTVTANIPVPNSQEYYRRQWIEAMASNPGASRSRLIRSYPEVYKWLRKNDLAWYEKNAPASKKSIFDWEVTDNEYLKKAMAAVEYLRSLQGKPLWINRRSVEKYAGINNLYRNLSKGYLPKTKAYLDENLETDEEWRKRKIRWAVQTLYEEERNLLIPQIKIKAAISPKMFTLLEEFTLDCIAQIQKTEETIEKQST